jgi:hypothetical protein
MKRKSISLGMDFMSGSPLTRAVFLLLLLDA